MATMAKWAIDDYGFYDSGHKIAYKKWNNTLFPWSDSTMSFTRVYVIRGNHWWIASLVTKKNIIHGKLYIMLYISSALSKEIPQPCIKPSKCLISVPVWVWGALFGIINRESATFWRALVRSNAMRTSAGKTAHLFTHPCPSMAVYLHRRWNQDRGDTYNTLFYGDVIT